MSLEAVLPFPTPPAPPPAPLDPAYELWRAGALVPYLVTRMLDANGLYGPDVDRACLAEEPAVDEWEAGTRYPTWPQLLALAELVGVEPAYLFKLTTQDAGRLASPVFLCGPAGCDTVIEDGVAHVLEYPVDVVRATVGSDA